MIQSFQEYTIFLALKVTLCLVSHLSSQPSEALKSSTCNDFANCRAFSFRIMPETGTFFARVFWNQVQTALSRSSLSAFFIFCYFRSISPDSKASNILSSFASQVETVFLAPHIYRQQTYSMFQTEFLANYCTLPMMGLELATPRL